MKADEALACLAHRRIVWLGDSLTRYQVMALVFWLANGEYQDPYDFVASGGVPSFSNEHTWPSWQVYLDQVPKLLAEDGCITATCHDCVHAFDALPKDSQQASMEIHFFEFSLTSGAKVIIEFRLLLGRYTVLEEGTKALNWALNRSLDAIPDVLIFNMGIFVVHSDYNAQNVTVLLHLYETLFQHATIILAAHGPRATSIVFKATTPFDLPKDSTSWPHMFYRIEPLLRELAAFYGILYYDVFSLARAVGAGTEIAVGRLPFLPFCVPPIQ